MTSKKKRNKIIMIVVPIVVVTLFVVAFLLFSNKDNRKNCLSFQSIDDGVELIKNATGGGLIICSSNHNECTIGGKTSIKNWVPVAVEQGYENKYGNTFDCEEYINAAIELNQNSPVTLSESYKNNLLFHFEAESAYFLCLGDPEDKEYLITTKELDYAHSIIDKYQQNYC